MKHHTYGTRCANKRHEQHSAVATAYAVLCLLFACVALAVALPTAPGRVWAAGSQAPLSVQATGTPGAGSNALSNQPVVATASISSAASSDVAPLPAGTVIAPAPQSSAHVPPPRSSQVVPAPGSDGATPVQAASGGFPWWLVIPLVVLALAGVALAMFRTRRPSAVTVTTSPALPPSARVSPDADSITTSTTSTTSTLPTAEADMGASLGAPLVASAGVIPVSVPPAPPAAPEQIECPNCGSMNGMDENFCHECGQDLKQARAAALAGMANEPVDEYTPYLETLGRIDEQLEYVLSRPRITIGSAPKNDIVVDSAFRGQATVSAVHAELRRQGDGFLIADAGSNTGTFVNDARITEQLLADNDRIRVGEVRFVYHAPARS